MLYTGNGDAGYTNVIGGSHISKCDVRLEALGALDEAQAQLGVVRAMLPDTPFAESIRRVGQDMHLLMGECATIPQRGVTTTYITPAQLSRLEDELRAWEERLSSFSGFTVPGETVPGAHLHVARTVVRRAERCVAALYLGIEDEHSMLFSYLNRLSSWLYILAQLLEKTPNQS